MPRTALKHFQEDIAWARAIVSHADALPHSNAAQELLRSDLLRSATIQTLVNKFFRKGHRFFQDCLDDWISRPDFSSHHGNA